MKHSLIKSIRGLKTLAVLCLVALLNACSSSPPESIYRGRDPSHYSELHVFSDRTVVFYYQIEGHLKAVVDGTIRESGDRLTVKLKGLGHDSYYRRFLYKGVEYLVDEELVEDLVNFDDAEESPMDLGALRLTTKSQYIDDIEEELTSKITEGVAMSKRGLVSFRRKHLPTLEAPVLVEFDDKETVRVAFEHYLATHPELKAYAAADIEIHQEWGTYWCSIKGPKGILVLEVKEWTREVRAAITEVRQIPDSSAGGQKGSP